MSRQVLIVLTVSGLALGGAAAYFLSRAPVDQGLAEDRSNGGSAAGSHPAEQWKEQVKSDALRTSLKCVGADGVMTCGEYAGQPALVYLAITDARDALPGASTRDVLIRYGDQAVAAAAANGNLDTIRVLVDQGARFELLDANSLGRYPLFEGAKSDAAHPAAAAAEAGHIDVLDYFVQRGFDVNSKVAQDGITDVFLSALLNRRAAVLRHLLDHGYRLDCQRRMPNGRTYRDVANSMNFTDAVTLLDRACPGT